MQAEQMVDLLRRVRHDFANHLQVIGGYLELGNPEQVKIYLSKLVEALNQEKIIFAISEAGASLYLYEQLLRARDMGIILHYEDIGINSWEVLKANDEPYRSLANLLKPAAVSDDDEIVCLTVSEDEQGVNMHFARSAGEVSPQVVRVNKE